MIVNLLGLEDFRFRRGFVVLGSGSRIKITTDWRVRVKVVTKVVSIRSIALVDSLQGCG